MSSLPLISHRLFVAAVGSEGNAPAKPIQNESGFWPESPAATAISLEVLSHSKSMPSEGTRRLAARQDRGSS